MRTLHLEGIILKRKNSGEADRILTIFTRHYGKMQVKAVGVRKIASKRSSHTEPLNIISMVIYKGKLLPILTEVTTLENFSFVKEDLKKIGYAYHLCELIDGLCPENQEQESVYVLLVDVLRKFSQTENLADIIHSFEVSLLTLLGYWSEKQELQKTNVSYLIESILERRLKSRQILPQLF